MTLQEIARALGGEVQGDQVLAPGPGHSPKDRSLAVMLSSTAPDGFVVYSHAGDDPIRCKYHIRTKLGLDPFKASGKSRGAATYDYTDELGHLLFQVVRFEPKDFRQRRPNGNGGWDWKLGDTPRVLYRLPNLLEAISSDRHIFIAEGEKAVDRLLELGVTATCSPAGAGKWRDSYSKHLNGADVVILPDNDEPGKAHAAMVAKSLAGVAARVRVLRLPGLPDKGDPFDWIAAGGTAEQLWQLVENNGSRATGSELRKANGPDAQPPPDQLPAVMEPRKETRIKLVPFDKILLGTERPYLVRGLIPRSGLTVIWGPPKSGKSFSTFDLVMHVALGWDYRGRRVQQGPVVYCAFEGQSGIKRRVEAFRQHHLAEDVEGVPFYLQPIILDLAKDSRELIAAIRDTLGEMPPIVVALDTLNRSLAGSESSDEDMTAYVRAADAIREAFDCAVLIVHHCGVDGTRPRGHTSLTGAADAQHAVKRDLDGNITVTVEWMKDGDEGETVCSRLEKVEVGIDEDGEPITSCVVIPTEVVSTDRHSRATGAAKVALDLLRRAICDAGEIPPASNHIKPDIRAVSVDLWRRYCYEGSIAGADTPDARQKAFVRGSQKLQSIGAIGKWGEWVWPT